ncbi:MAG: FecR domain-containing protein [Thermoanaerobaculia bacterium]
MKNDRRDNRPPRPMDDEEIRDLLATAGPRPRVPERDLARIRAAARAEWQELVVARQKPAISVRRLASALAAAGLLVALGVGWWWRDRTLPVEPVPIAVVELLEGNVRALGLPDGEPDGRRDLTVGDVLVADTTLTTDAGQAPGIVALTLADGESVRLDSGTRVRLVSRRRLALDAGTLYADSGVSTPPGREGLEIATAWGSVRDMGTQFEVRVADDEDVALRVRVREGGVAIASGGESHTVIGGQELRMHGDRTVSLHEVARYGPAWEWTVAAAPGIDIEGRTLASFLEWAGRETGWKLRYADAEAARAAAEIRLQGTIEGLTPDQAVRVVLPGSRFDSRLKEGTLTVFRTRD